MGEDDLEGGQAQELCGWEGVLAMGEDDQGEGLAQGLIDLEEGPALEKVDGDLDYKMVGEVEEGSEGGNEVVACQVEDRLVERHIRCQIHSLGGAEEVYPCCGEVKLLIVSSDLYKNIFDLDSESSMPSQSLGLYRTIQKLVP